MITNTTQERRRYKRIRKNFVAKFRLKCDRSGIESAENWEMVTTHDLSAGGVLFNYDKEISVGSLVDMFINFPQVKTPINCVGKILRIGRSNPLSLLKIAANFIDIKEEDKQEINRAAEEFYSKQSGRIET